MQQGEHTDVVVSEIALGYENFLHEQSDNASKGLPTIGKKYSESELTEMMDTTREEYGSNSK